MQDEKSQLLRTDSGALKKALAEVRHLRVMVRRAELQASRFASARPRVEQKIMGPAALSAGASEHRSP
jgi:hypothetical protein